MPSPRFLLPMLSLAICLSGSAGCGTTRLTDTSRSASEEMLLSHSIDLSVGQLNLDVLAGRTVFVDTTHLKETHFSGYLTSALRQHLLASGARLVNDPARAEIVVEARAGSVATTRHDTLVGIPQTTVPTILFGSPGTIPEIAISKKTIHIGVAKVGVFAYRTDTGAGVWQSGMQENQSTSQSSWYLGVGPFQTGDVVLDGNPENRGEMGSSQHRPGRRSSLEFESWTGGMPPVTPLLPPISPPARPGREAAPQAIPEPIPPGSPEQEPVHEDSWQLVAPVVISRQ